MGKKFCKVAFGIDSKGLSFCDGVLSNGTKRVRIASGAESAVLTLFLLSPYRIRLDEIISFLWPDPEDEPSDPENMVRVRLATLRKALKPLGYRLSVIYKLGYVLEKADG